MMYLPLDQLMKAKGSDQDMPVRALSAKELSEITQ